MRVTVYCGSSFGASPAYADAARNLGKLLADREIGLVYGGSRLGTMGILADAVLAAGGEATGVIPRALVDREIASDNLTALHVVDNMHERKARMAELGDAFVALPGGAGTLEELFEIWTWGPLLGIHHKPVGVLDVNGYYTRLTAFIDHMVSEGFIRPDLRAALLVEEDPARLLERFAAYRPPPTRFDLDPADVPASAGVETPAGPPDTGRSATT